MCACMPMSVSTCLLLALSEHKHTGGGPVGETSTSMLTATGTHNVGCNFSFIHLSRCSAIEWTVQSDYAISVCVCPKARAYISFLNWGIRFEQKLDISSVPQHSSFDFCVFFCDKRENKTATGQLKQKKNVRYGHWWPYSPKGEIHCRNILSTYCLCWSRQAGSLAINNVFMTLLNLYLRYINIIF